MGVIPHIRQAKLLVPSLSNRTRNEQHLWRNSSTSKIRGRIDHRVTCQAKQLADSLLEGRIAPEAGRQVVQSLAAADFSGSTTSAPGMFCKEFMSHV
jgi:hypothetical protein